MSKWKYAVIATQAVDTMKAQLNTSFATAIEIILNNLGKQGFRIVPIELPSSDVAALMEREVPDSPPASLPNDESDDPHGLS